MRQTSFLPLVFFIICMFYQVNAFSINMIPIDSPHLQILPKSLTANERHHILGNISMSRAYHANKANARNFGLDSITFDYSKVQNSYFVTRFTIGRHEPAFSPIVILDTATDQTWIQCSKCNPCFKLNDTFIVENSTSFARMGLSDNRCSPKVSYEGSCGFTASLGPGRTEGYMGTDVLTLNNATGFFPNIAFGCGVKNSNFTFGDDPANVIAGVFGLAPGPKSFLNQLDLEIKGRFTYCLRADSNSSQLLFGDTAQIYGDTSRKVQTMLMYPEARYHLYLTSITVQGVRLTIDPSLFEIDDRDYTRGFFIDPSSAYTVLTNTAYQALRVAIVNHFSGYKMEESKAANKVFDLCYSGMPDEQKEQIYPTVIFNFLKSAGDGGEVHLEFDPTNIFGNFENGFCMQIYPTADGKDGPSILGAYQQANFQFLFDVKTQLVSFVPREC